MTQYLVLKTSFPAAFFYIQTFDDSTHFLFLSELSKNPVFLLWFCRKEVLKAI